MNRESTILLLLSIVCLVFSLFAFICEEYFYFGWNVANSIGFTILAFKFNKI